LAGERNGEEGVIRYRTQLAGHKMDTQWDEERMLLVRARATVRRTVVIGWLCLELTGKAPSKGGCESLADSSAPAVCLFPVPGRGLGEWLGWHLDLFEDVH